MQNEIKEALKGISEDILNHTKLSMINNGGCAYLAYFVKSELEKFNINCKFVYIDRDEAGSSKEVMGRIIDKDRRGSAPHVVLQVEDVYFDAGGIYSNKETITREWTNWRGTAVAVPIEMKSKEYYHYALYNKRYQWNDMYNFRKCNPIVGRIVKKHFSKITLKQTV